MKTFASKFVQPQAFLRWLMALLAFGLVAGFASYLSIAGAAAQSSADVTGNPPSAESMPEWQAVPAPNFKQPRGEGRESSSRPQSILSPVPSLSRSERSGVQVLRHVAQIKLLSPERAALRIPLRLAGTVTDFSGYKNSFYFQESGLGISVDRTDHADVHVGDRVDITGTSGPGLFAPVVLASDVRVVGHGPPPTARRVTFRQMVGGVQDSQWVEVQGVVHSTHRSKVFDIDVLTLGLEIDGGRVPILLHDFQGIDARKLVDSTIRVRGVCSSEFNNKRQFLGMEIDVPQESDLEVIERSAEDPFFIPITPVGSAFQFGNAQHRIRVAGTVTQQTSGQSLYLQKGNDGLRVQTSSTERVKPGTQIEAVGFPVMGDYSPMLADGIVRIVGNGPPVLPIQIEAREVLKETDGFDDVPYGEELVQLQGEVVESHIQAGETVWMLRRGDQMFEAHLPAVEGRGQLHAVGRGSLLQLTGICKIVANYERDPTSFIILLRSPQDIKILRRASWWTPTHLLLLLSALLTVTLVIALWVMMLRERVKRQTRIIRESEGRFRYLADHDGLTGLLNRNAILASLAQELTLADRRTTGVCVAIIDIDHFKQINDSLGHLAGDEVLRQAALRFSYSIRTQDAIGRYGGEEFLIVFSEVDGQMGVERCEAIRQALSGIPILYEGDPVHVTCSIGLSSVYAGRESTTVLIAQADDALYQAKSAGRNRVECWLGRRPREAPALGILTEAVARAQIGVG